MDIVFDIDGTLADAMHRLHFIEGEYRDWDNFLSEDQIAKDGPIKPIWEILNAMHNNGHRIIFITGRNVKTYDQTLKWIQDMANERAHEYGHEEFPIIYMARSENDRRPSDVVKRLGLQQAREDGYNPQLVFEDRSHDAAMWREEGLLCCQVAEGNY